MKQRREINVICVAAAVVATGVVLAGCSAGGPEYDKIKNNITPELMTASQRPVDVESAVALNWNTDNRLFWNDMGRAFYTDRPSHLSPFAIPR